MTIHPFRLILFLAVAALLPACQKDNIPPLGTPYSQVQGINDNWKLTGIIQVDELTGGTFRQLDVSGLLLGSNPATANFNASDRTFSASANDSRIYLPASGTWAFDDDTYPTRLILTDGGGNVSELPLQRPVRERVDQNLVVKFTRPIGDCAEIEKPGAVSYIYTFTRN